MEPESVNESTGLDELTIFADSRTAIAVQRARDIANECLIASRKELPGSYQTQQELTLHVAKAGDGTHADLC